MRSSATDNSTLSGHLLRVGVISPHDLVRQGLVALLGSTPGLELVSVPSETDQFGLPDAVVYDQLRRLGPERVRSASEAFTVSAGLGTPAVARLSLAATKGDFLAAIELAAQTCVRIKGRPGRNPAGLSDRQYETVALVASGLSNAEIAEQLFVSVNTVKTNLRAAYRRLGVTSRTQAVLWYLEDRYWAGNEVADDRLDAPLLAPPPPPPATEGALALR